VASAATQITQPGVLERLGRESDRLVVLVEQLSHERGHRVEIERFTSCGDCAQKSYSGHQR
jgi:hypothetical protein